MAIFDVELSAEDRKLVRKFSHAQLHLVPGAGCFVEGLQRMQFAMFDASQSLLVDVAQPGSCRVRITMYGRPKEKRSLLGKALDFVGLGPEEAEAVPIGEPVEVDLVVAAAEGLTAQLEFGQGSQVHGLSVSAVSHFYAPSTRDVQKYGGGPASAPAAAAAAHEEQHASAAAPAVAAAATASPAEVAPAGEVKLYNHDC
jgi:hypothetical protein